MNVEVILNCSRGLVVAPAGCGKTHLITSALSNPTSNKPYLVLTHTTAGVAALKQRLKRLSVSPKNYVVTTIDGWALRVASYFPGLCPIRYQQEQGQLFYPELRRTVSNLLHTGQLDDIIQSSYSRLFVDEYQDCNVDQHCIVQRLSDSLPTVVFGDPMQCIFNFSGPMPNWTHDVETFFPTLMVLNTPWRWNNAGASLLGSWILQCRHLLLARSPVNFSSCPSHVRYRKLTGNATVDTSNRQAAHYGLIQAYPNDSVLILGSSTNLAERHFFAQRTNSVDVVEPVDLGSVTRAAAQFDNLDGINLVQTVLASIAQMMTNVEIPQTLQRLSTIQEGRNRKPPSPVEHSLICLMQSKSIRNLLDVMIQFDVVNIFRTHQLSSFF